MLTIIASGGRDAASRSPTMQVSEVTTRKSLASNIPLRALCEA
jgi:hypothetical protein